MIRKPIQIAGALMILAPTLMGGCAREPVSLTSRMGTAVTPPAEIADWFIGGRNDFIVFDLRDESEYADGHLPNAVLANARDMARPGIAKAMPDYKKLVFYGSEETVPADTLAPFFQQGLHVVVMEGGYDGWRRQVLASPEAIRTPGDAKRDAVARYFRGESLPGGAKPSGEISAEQYLRPADLPEPEPASTYEAEGC